MNVSAPAENTYASKKSKIMRPAFALLTRSADELAGWLLEIEMEQKMCVCVYGCYLLRFYCVLFSTTFTGRIRCEYTENDRTLQDHRLVNAHALFKFQNEKKKKINNRPQKKLTLHNDAKHLP